MIGLYTDFGLNGSYIGQMIAAIDHYSPKSKVINIQSDLPKFDIEAASILLAAYHQNHLAGNIHLCVVDPEVGTELRKPVVVTVDARIYVGPNNGIFDRIIAIANEYEVSEIVWRPERLSNSFHGRDLFAPIAAMIDDSTIPNHALRCFDYEPHITSQSSPRIVYVDHYGNCMTGLFASEYPDLQSVTIAGKEITRATTFAEVEKGEPLLYENSSGLLEIAVNQGRADEMLGLVVGSEIVIKE